MTGGEDGAMRGSMEIYPRTAAERAMKLQEVLLRATAGKIKWLQAAELMGISERQMRRWRKRLEEQGYMFVCALPPGERMLRVGALLYLAACVGCLVAHSPVGSNVERYGVLLAGPLL